MMALIPYAPKCWRLLGHPVHVEFANDARAPSLCSFCMAGGPTNYPKTTGRSGTDRRSRSGYVYQRHILWPRCAPVPWGKRREGAHGEKGGGGSRCRLCLTPCCPGQHPLAVDRSTPDMSDKIVRSSCQSKPMLSVLGISLRKTR